MNPVEHQNQKEALANRQRERQARVESARRDPAAAAALLEVPEGDKPLMDRIQEDVEKNLLTGKKDSIKLEDLNSFQRRLVYERVLTSYYKEVSATKKMEKRNEVGHRLS